MLNRTRYLFQLRNILHFSSPVTSRFRGLHEDFQNERIRNTENKEISGSIKDKYIIYNDEDSVEIFDIEEEKQNNYIDLKPTHVTEFSEEGLNLKRGLTGVYDIDDLVAVLERQSADNIFVCPIAKELNYVDHMCIVTGRNQRHMLAIAQFVRKIYKRKCTPNDILPKIEGEKCDHWLAIDLGNIALHIFSEEAREKYDLETLWTLGPEFDKESNKPKDDLIYLYQQHSKYLNEISKESNLNENKS